MRTYLRFYHNMLSIILLLLCVSSLSCVEVFLQTSLTSPSSSSEFPLCTLSHAITLHLYLRILIASAAAGRWNCELLVKRTICVFVFVWLLQHDYDDGRRRRKPDGTGVDLFVRPERNYSSRRFNSGTTIYIVSHKSNGKTRKKSKIMASTTAANKSSSSCARLWSNECDNSDALDKFIFVLKSTDGSWPVWLHTGTCCLEDAIKL